MSFDKFLGILDKLKTEKFNMLWIKHPRSKEPDTMLTLSVYAFAATLFKFLANGASFGDVSLGTTDPMLIGAILGPTLIAYTARKMKSPPETPNPSSNTRRKKQ